MNKITIKSKHVFILLGGDVSDKYLESFLGELRMVNPNHDIKILKPNSLNTPITETNELTQMKQDIASTTTKTIHVACIQNTTFLDKLDWMGILQRIKNENILLKSMLESRSDIILCQLISKKSTSFSSLIKFYQSTIKDANHRTPSKIEGIVRISYPIKFNDTTKFESVKEFRKYILSRLTILETSCKPNKLYDLGNKLYKNKIQKEILKPISPSTLLKEITNLDTSSKLLSYNEFDIYLVDFNKVPNCMLEIGRLRELTFRNASEGTGFILDLDYYDPFYKHIFIWNREKLEIVGAYRLIEGHDVIPKLGKKGFYISSLFKIKNEFVPTLLQTVELGRSFIIPSYQKSHCLLLLMWKAIYQYIQRSPNNRYVIGPVSISEEYSKISRLLIIDYLNKFHQHKEFSAYFKARKPFRYINLKGTQNIIIRNFEQDIHKLDQLISEIQINQQKIPILLRQYLKQNAKVLAFNRDPKFNNVMDALLIFDLQESANTLLTLIQEPLKS